MDTVELIKKDLDALNKRLEALANQKTEPIVGQWRITKNGCLFIYQRTGKYGLQGFGLDTEGIWCDFDPESNGHWSGVENSRPATPEEVKSALVAQLEKQGIKEGVTVQAIGVNLRGEISAGADFELKGAVVYHPAVGVLVRTVIARTCPPLKTYMIPPTSRRVPPPITYHLNLFQNSFIPSLSGTGRAGIAP